MKRIFVLLCLAFSLHSFAQNDSCELEISLLTCEPGEDLYAIFGHTALRVKDRVLHTDVIYNYGTFDFEDPDFYMKFVKGNLLYYLSTESVNDFLFAYRMENRGVTEQILRLPCEEKQSLAIALRENAREENKYYHYDFVADNCSTRPKDIVKNNIRQGIQFKNILPQKPPSFRDLLHEYLDKGGQYWSKLGIDMLLGSKVDQPVTNEEAMFLPGYLMKGFDSAMVNNRPLVSEKKILLPAVQANNGSGAFGPLTITTVLLILIGSLSFSRSAGIQRALDIFDIGFFLILGLLGCLLLYMWLGTHHRLFGNNYNLLWALPTHLPAALLMFSKKQWVKKYFSVAAVFYLLVILAWAFLPQQLNTALFPVTLLAGIRCFARSKK